MVQSNHKKNLMNNIRLSGLKGKALQISKTDIPTMNDIKNVVPSKCFKRNTFKSLRYLFQSIILQIIVVAIGLSIPIKQEMLFVWIIYAVLSGTVAMGFWVLAHECGHGAFSDNKKLETFVGYFLHSILLVPYFSWQRSHAVHHRFTNHITNGETHVPLVIGSNKIGEKIGGEKEVNLLKSLGKFKYGIIQLVLHLVFGWPAYLLSGATGGPKYGMSNHFWPTKPFSKNLWPSIWAKKVWLSDIGVVATLLTLIIWSYKVSFYSVLCLYILPLLVVNSWLVIYTWLHHTDTDVPHLAGDEFSYIRGAFLSIDRPYGKIIDFLHHRIGSTHVIHHISPTIPHYYAKDATDSIKKAFPKIYLYNPTPIYKALWNIACNCIAVKAVKGSEEYYWQKI